jgi:hypothetical protein
MYIKSFNNLEQCLQCLKDLGCNNEKKYKELHKNSITQFKGTTIIYDPYNLLHF